MDGPRDAVGHEPAGQGHSSSPSDHAHAHSHGHDSLEAGADGPASTERHAAGTFPLTAPFLASALDRLILAVVLAALVWGGVLWAVD